MLRPPCDYDHDIAAVPRQEQVTHANRSVRYTHIAPEASPGRDGGSEQAQRPPEGCKPGRSLRTVTQDGPFGPIRFKWPLRAGKLALAGLHARVFLVNDVNAPMAAHHAAVLVAGLGRFQAVADLHDVRPWLRGKEARELEVTARHVKHDNADASRNGAQRRAGAG